MQAPAPDNDGGKIRGAHGEGGRRGSPEDFGLIHKSCLSVDGAKSKAKKMNSDIQHDRGGGRWFLAGGSTLIEQGENGEILLTKRFLPMIYLEGC